MNNQTDIRFLSGLHEVVGSYDGFIIDVMGVVHNGANLLPDVIDCLTALKDYDKKVIFLSNAPRRSYITQKRLDKLGLPRNLYSHIITSGESVYHNLKLRPNAWYKQLGNRAYHIGQDKDLSLFDDNACEKVEDLDAADFILTTDFMKHSYSIEDYDNLLKQAQALQLPMICANPDIVVQIKGSLQYCAGAIAKRYEELGGDVTYIGKPFPSIYQWVKEEFPSHSRLLAIGDAFETDIKGAQGAHIDSAFVSSGIHSNDLNVEYGQLPQAEDMTRLASQHNATPTYILPGLIF